MLEPYEICFLLAMTLWQCSVSGSQELNLFDFSLLDKMGLPTSRNLQITFVGSGNRAYPDLVHYASFHFIRFESSIYRNDTEDLSNMFGSNIIIKSCKDITEIQTSIKQVSQRVQIEQIHTNGNLYYWKPLVLLELMWNESYNATEETLIQVLNPIPKVFTFDSQIYIIAWKGDGGSHFETFEVYWSIQWSIVKSIQEVRGDISTPTRRYNLQGAVVKYIFYVDKNLRFETSVQLPLNVMSAFSRRLNFSSVNVSGEGWIGMSPNGSLSGMGKQLDDGEGDIIIQPTDLTMYRNRKLSFLLPTVSFRQRAYFRQPSKFYGGILLQPYSVGGWIGLVTSLIIVGVVGLIINASRRLECITLGEIGTTMFHTLSQLSQQGLETESFVCSSRIVTFLGFLLGTLYYNLYSGSILSLISFQGPSVRSFEELTTSGMYFLVDNYLTNPQAYINDLPRKSDNLMEQILSTEEGLQRLMTGEYAFITNNLIILQKATLVLNLTEDDFCKLNLFNFPVSSGSALYFNGRYMKKNSPFSKMFSFVDLQLKERGVTYRDTILTYFRINTPKCTKIQEPVTALTFPILSSVFLLYLVTASVAGVILIGEFIAKNQLYFCSCITKLGSFYYSLIYSYT